MNYRKSFEGLNLDMIRKIDDYDGLPEELKEYCYYFDDCGYVIMAVPESLLMEHWGEYDLWQYEIPVPVKYVLENGYHEFEGYIVTDVEYDDEMGAIIDDKYYEY